MPCSALLMSAYIFYEEMEKVMPRIFKYSSIPSLLVCNRSKREKKNVANTVEQSSLSNSSFPVTAFCGLPHNAALLYVELLYSSHPSVISRAHCSKLTTSLVNDSLTFASSDTQICWIFCWKKMWVALQKLLTFFQQKISEYCILNPLKQLTKWTLTSSLS